MSNTKNLRALIIPLIIIVTTAVVGLVAWQVFRSTNESTDPTRSSNPNLQVYSPQGIGFSFEQPKEWVTRRSTSGDTTTVTTQSPGTQLSGSDSNLVVQKGAAINITKSPCQDCSLDNIYESYKSAESRTQTTVAGEKAAQFTVKQTTHTTQHTVFYKDNNKYEVTYTAADESTASRYLAAYAVVLGSLTIQ